MADWPYNTARWQRLRLAHLQLSPLCIACEAMNMLVPANTVDHVVPISEGGNAFPGHDGLASYCPACHGAKTARGAEAGAVRSTKPRKGCDADGNPLDPAHPWRGKSLGADGLGPTPLLHAQLVYERSRSPVGFLPEPATTARPKNGRARSSPNGGKRRG